jgi:hypothetical protein
MWFTPLFRGQTWRELWVAIRRLRRDARARAFVLRFFGLVLAALYGTVLVLTVAAGLLGHTGFTAIAAIVSICIVSIFLVHKWRDRQEARAAPPVVAPVVQQEMHREAFLLAILLNRAGSERMMEKELPPDIEVVTRRFQREQLVRHGLWDDLSSAMKDLLLLPNGHWSQEQKSTAESCWEFFIVLRWVMRLDDSLRSLDRTPSYDLVKTRDIIARYEVLKPGDTLAPWDLRPVRDEAYLHFGRLWTEAVARGLVEEGVEPDHREQAVRAKGEIDVDGGSNDLLIDAQTVSELSDSSLWYLLRAAIRRWEIVNFLIPWLLEEQPGDQLRLFWGKVISV